MKFISLRAMIYTLYGPFKLTVTFLPNLWRLERLQVHYLDVHRRMENEERSLCASANPILRRMTEHSPLVCGRYNEHQVSLVSHSYNVLQRYFEDFTTDKFCTKPSLPSLFEEIVLNFPHRRRTLLSKWPV